MGAAFERRGPVVIISPDDPNAVQLPPPRWEDPALSTPILEQLHRCLAVVERP